MLKEMLKESPRDTTREYNILLNACAKARKWKHAQQVFEVRVIRVETNPYPPPHPPFRSAHTSHKQCIDHPGALFMVGYARRQCVPELLFCRSHCRGYS